jgi:hypothetical protein
LYRETDTFPDDLGAAIFRLEFVLHHIIAGLITPAPANAVPARPDHNIQKAARQLYWSGIPNEDWPEERQAASSAVFSANSPS